MARKPKKRTKYIKLNKISVDTHYQSSLIQKLIKYVMKDGKLQLANKIVYSAIDVFYDDYMKKTATGEEKNLDKAVMVKILFDRLVKAGPDVEVKSKRLGGANYQVPVPVNAERKVTLLYRWILKCARKRKGSTMTVNLARELMDLIANRGSVVKEMENLRKMVSANAVFANMKGKAA